MRCCAATPRTTISADAAIITRHINARVDDDVDDGVDAFANAPDFITVCSPSAVGCDHLTHARPYCTALARRNSADSVPFFRLLRSFPFVSSPLFTCSISVRPDVASQRPTPYPRNTAAMNIESRLVVEILDNSPSLIFMKDPAGRYTFVNRSFTEAFGLRREEILGRTDAEIFSPAQAEMFRANDLRVLAEGRRMEFDELAELADGLHVSIVQKFPLRDASGAIEALCGIATDITERKRTEQALRRINRLYAVSSGINEAIVRLREPAELYERACRIAVEQGNLRLAWVGICDADGRIAPVARYGADEGYVDRIILTMRDERINRGPAGRALSTGVCAVSNDIAADENFFWKKEALRRGLRSCAVFPIRIEGRATGILAIYAEEPDYFHDEELRVLNALADNIAFAVESARNESERKRAEQERARLEARLHQAQKMQSLGTLAGGVAHDFNNILTAMMGNAQVAAIQLPADHPVHRNLEEIERAGERAADLIRRILTFTRRQDPHRRPLLLQSVVEEVLRLMRATIPSRIHIETHFADSLPEVSADSTQIHQIVMNLCTNAVHAIGEHSGRIEIRLCEAELNAESYAESYESYAEHIAAMRNGHAVRLSIIDDGCGMDAATIERIFDPFFTTKAPGQGTGLGLSVVHGIVQNHEATIAVESRPGEGTAFHIYFPALAPSPADADTAEKS